MAKKLSGKTAIVTGGTKGIGQGIVKKFLDEGANVTFTGLEDDLGHQEMEKYGDRSLFILQDVSKEADWQKVIDQTMEKFGQLDIVVNDAGISELADIEHVTMDQWNKIIGVNLTGVMLGNKYGIINMKKHGGSIVNIASIAALIGISNGVGYNATKGGVRLLTKSAALYCAEQKYNIRVNAIEPGSVKTPMVDALPKDVQDSFAKPHPMGRMATPEEIARLVLFVAADATFATGSDFVEDGGYTAK